MNNENTKLPKLLTSGVTITKKGSIDREAGIIRGVSVCTEGEAKGHGVHLDSEFIQTVTDLGNAKKQGLKARFGHPNMCSTALGTFIGRYKNFTVEGNKAKADLFLSVQHRSSLAFCVESTVDDRSGYPG